ncbi:hypothetical protein NN3_21220 [Nocardia neocaledoniensis NBRC 108232]|uniref:Mce-associated membrane protein n=1 Tax=Nocardia neocaledoniensis TaxID=236511 RepID=A0A317N4T5_9NOCA|nr:hypothetical protein [Nocardia neocaledoniensis]PWV69929.1 Mce-associated membrane protein [Nocardia neocaledoniensis]GEM31115.1 hypothetical protein NN3_21220 [Nocardia neocaledoniensis NBRC 108232]
MSTATAEPTTTEPAQRPPRTVSLRISSVLVAATIGVLAVATVTFAALYFSARSTIADRDARAADDRHAERIATDYGVGASTIDYRDVAAWFGRLRAGTSPQLAAKFDATAPQLEQILLPLQWTSTATPLSATVTSESGGIYKVNAYFTVVSTSAQNPQGAATTVTYSLTIDRAAGWQITEVGGLQHTLPAK